MDGKRNFGFEIHSGRQIDLDHADISFAAELAEVVCTWSACINCGSCAATCPAGLNFRKFHYQIRLGVGADDYLSPKTDNYPSLRSCLLCGKCQLVCPRGIPTRYLSILMMQKIKPHAENIPSV